MDPTVARDIYRFVTDYFLWIPMRVLQLVYTVDVVQGDAQLINPRFLWVDDVCYKNRHNDQKSQRAVKFKKVFIIF